MITNNQFVKEQISDILNAYNPNSIPFVVEGGDLAFPIFLDQPRGMKNFEDLKRFAINPDSSNIAIVSLSAKINGNSLVWDKAIINGDTYNADDFNSEEFKGYNHDTTYMPE